MVGAQCRIFQEFIGSASTELHHHVWCCDPYFALAMIAFIDGELAPKVQSWSRKSGDFSVA